MALSTTAPPRRRGAAPSRFIRRCPTSGDWCVPGGRATGWKGWNPVRGPHYSAQVGTVRSRARPSGLLLSAVTLLGLWLARPAKAADLNESSASSAADRPPSVVLITVDTTRWDHLQPYGADVQTPVLAALATQGVLFEQAYAVAPITLPAHTAIHTGLYPPQSGVIGGLARQSRERCAIDPDGVASISPGRSPGNSCRS